ncbi:homing endonuclease associated repeat-containing protein [Halarchaeum salinum]|uniref:Uncharacterized protein n=1 Tax=Halarchaeum salinum TaxID=489912 RepID=A0AAV3S903_9EURY
MSSHSKAATLLADGKHEQASRRLESARESLDEAATLNDDYSLGRAASIQEKRETITERLNEAAQQPREELEERLATAEAAVKRGITARSADDYETAVEAFRDAYDAYQSMHDHATKYDLDATWEVEQRESMVAEYLDVAEAELDERQQTIRDSLGQVLDDAEATLVRAEQYNEVDDQVSARESLDGARRALDDAAQLVETDLAATTQEDRYSTLETRAQTLASKLPEETVNEYRDRDLIDALQRLTTKLDESPRPEFINKYGDYPADAYLESFGSWTDALAAANLDPIDEAARERRKYSRVEVLDALVALTDELGQPPSRTEMNRKGAVSSTTVANRFADWETAIEFAENVSENATDEDATTAKRHGETDPTADDNSESDETETEGGILGQIEDELSGL